MSFSLTTSNAKIFDTAEGLVAAQEAIRGVLAALRKVRTAGEDETREPVLAALHEARVLVTRMTLPSAARRAASDAWIDLYETALALECRAVILTQAEGVDPS
jgi:hypothetical protein